MYSTSNATTNDRTSWWMLTLPQQVEISITPEGEPALLGPTGALDLFTPACRTFGRLDAENVFTATRNVFQNVEVRRVNVLSDHCAMCF